MQYRNNDKFWQSLLCYGGLVLVILYELAKPYLVM